MPNSLFQRFLSNMKSRKLTSEVLKNLLVRRGNGKRFKLKFKQIPFLLSSKKTASKASSTKKQKTESSQKVKQKTQTVSEKVVLPASNSAVLNPARLCHLYATSEVAGIAASGGLGSVGRDLPPNARRIGIDSRIIMPMHAYSGSGANTGLVGFESADHFQDRAIPLGEIAIKVGENADGTPLIKKCVIYKTSANLQGEKVPVYLVGNDQYFGDKKGRVSGHYSYADAAEIYTYFGIAVEAFVNKMLTDPKFRENDGGGFVPHVLDLNDWMATSCISAVEKRLNDLRCDPNNRDLYKYTRRISLSTRVHNSLETNRIDERMYSQMIGCTGDSLVRARDKRVKGKIDMLGVALNQRTSDLATPVSEHNGEELARTPGAGMFESKEELARTSGAVAGMFDQSGGWHREYQAMKRNRINAEKRLVDKINARKQIAKELFGAEDGEKTPILCLLSKPWFANEKWKEEVKKYFKDILTAYDKDVRLVIVDYDRKCFEQEKALLQKRLEKLKKAKKPELEAIKELEQQLIMFSSYESSIRANRRFIEKLLIELGIKEDFKKRVAFITPGKLKDNKKLKAACEAEPFVLNKKIRNRLALADSRFGIMQGVTNGTDTSQRNPALLEGMPFTVEDASSEDGKKCKGSGYIGIDKVVEAKATWKAEKRINELRMALSGRGIDSCTPVFTSATRITTQKGFDAFLNGNFEVMDEIRDDLIAKARDPKFKQEREASPTSDTNHDFVYLAKGAANAGLEHIYDRKLKDIVRNTPYGQQGRLLFHVGQSAGVNAWGDKQEPIYAGSDFYLSLSVWEPCGLSHLDAARLGCIPVVTSVGGQVSTVQHFDAIFYVIELKIKEEKLKKDLENLKKQANPDQKEEERIEKEQREVRLALKKAREKLIGFRPVLPGEKVPNPRMVYEPKKVSESERELDTRDMASIRECISLASQMYRDESKRVMYRASNGEMYDARRILKELIEHNMKAQPSWEKPLMVYSTLYLDAVAKNMGAQEAMRLAINQMLSLARAKVKAKKDIKEEKTVEILEDSFCEEILRGYLDDYNKIFKKYDAVGQCNIADFENQFRRVFRIMLKLKKAKDIDEVKRLVGHASEGLKSLIDSIKSKDEAREEQIKFYIDQIIGVLIDEYSENADKRVEVEGYKNELLKQYNILPASQSTRFDTDIKPYRVNVHYRRSDGSYNGFEVSKWNLQNTGKGRNCQHFVFNDGQDSYGKKIKMFIYDDLNNPETSTFSSVGFMIAEQSRQGNFGKHDVDKDRHITAADILEYSDKDKEVDVYVFQDDEEMVFVRPVPVKGEPVISDEGEGSRIEFELNGDLQGANFFTLNVIKKDGSSEVIECDSKKSKVVAGRPNKLVFYTKAKVKATDFKGFKPKYGKTDLTRQRPIKADVAEPARDNYNKVVINLTEALPQYFLNNPLKLKKYLELQIGKRQDGKFKTVAIAECKLVKGKDGNINNKAIEIIVDGNINPFKDKFDLKLVDKTKMIKFSSVLVQGGASGEVAYNPVEGDSQSGLVLECANKNKDNYRTITIDFASEDFDQDFKDNLKDFVTIEGKLPGQSTVTIKPKEVKIAGRRLTITLNESLHFTSDSEDFGLRNYRVVCRDKEGKLIHQKQVPAENVYDSQDFPTYDGDDLGLTFNKKGASFRVWTPVAANFDSDRSPVELLLYLGDANGDSKPVAIEMKASTKGTWKISQDDIKTQLEKLLPNSDAEKMLKHINQNGLEKLYYNYRAKIDGRAVEVVDPYAKAVGIDGKRGYVYNIDRADLIPYGFDVTGNRSRVQGASEGRGYSATPDAKIIEAHVGFFTADSSSGVPAGLRGTYLGMVYEGSRSPQGLETAFAKLKREGYTHIQLMPVAKAYHARESKFSVGYDWGYGVQHPMALSGAYSTEPLDPVKRIKEYRQLVATANRYGIRIINDVVFNHAYSGDQFSINKLVPGYALRTKKDARGNVSVSNSVLCGHELATERPMMEKLMVDSLVHFFLKLGSSGFRFDVGALIALKAMKKAIWKLRTMYLQGNAKTRGDINSKMADALRTGGLKDYKDKLYILYQNATEAEREKIRAAWAEVEKELFIDGELWDPGDLTGEFSFLSPDKRTVDEVAPYEEGIGRIGNTFKARLVGNFNDEKDSEDRLGFIFGSQSKGDPNLEAKRTDLTRAIMAFLHPKDFIQFVQCHDNYTLYDKIKRVLTERIGGCTEEEIKKLYKLAIAIKYTSQGGIMDHETEGFMGTKDKRALRAKSATMDRRSKKHRQMLEAAARNVQDAHGVLPAPDEADSLDRDSVSSGDELNNVDWLRLRENKDINDYEAGLRQLRSAHKSFRMESGSDIERHMHFLQEEMTKHSDLIAYTIDRADFIEGEKAHTIATLFNAGKEEIEVSLGKEKKKWSIVVNGEKAGEKAIKRFYGRKIKVPPQSTIVLVEEKRTLKITDNMPLHLKALVKVLNSGIGRFLDAIHKVLVEEKRTLKITDNMPLHLKALVKILNSGIGRFLDAIHNVFEKFDFYRFIENKIKKYDSERDKLAEMARHERQERRAEQDLALRDPRAFTPRRRVMLVTSECDAFGEKASSGGLGNFSSSFAKEMARGGVDISVVMPMYKGISNRDFINEKLEEIGKFNVKIADKTGKETDYECTIRRGMKMINGQPVTVYLVDNPWAFTKKRGEGDLYSYQDNAERFAIFSKAVVGMLERMKAGGELSKKGAQLPDILYTNEWQTAGINTLLAVKHKYDPVLQQIGRIYMAHNIEQKGLLDAKDYQRLYDLPAEEVQWNTAQCFDHKLGRMRASIVKAGAGYAHKVIVPSETHRAECLGIADTEYTKIIKATRINTWFEKRENDFKGIRSGIDEVEFNPENDSALIDKRYAKLVAKQKNPELRRFYEALADRRFKGNVEAFKRVNVQYLQREFLKLKPSECTGDAIVVSVIGRFTKQKGCDELTRENILRIIRETEALGRSVIITVKGSALAYGDTQNAGPKSDIKRLEALKRLSAEINELLRKQGKGSRILIVDDMDKRSMKQIMAATTVCWDPARFAPQDLVPMQAARYGALNAANRTGGLCDQVADLTRMHEDAEAGVREGESGGKPLKLAKADLEIAREEALRRRSHLGFIVQKKKEATTEEQLQQVADKPESNVDCLMRAIRFYDEHNAEFAEAQRFNMTHKELYSWTSGIQAHLEVQNEVFKRLNRGRFERVQVMEATPGEVKKQVREAAVPRRAMRLVRKLVLPERSKTPDRSAGITKTR